MIQDWPEPRKVKDIQSFLGFTNFYHCFIPEYSKITVPLTCLTCKDVPWNFDAKCHNMFNVLKSTFMTVPILAHYTPNAQLVIETDASDYAVAAILSQWQNGELHPLAFFSCTMTATELNYNVHDKELLVIFSAFLTWCHYLEGTALPVNIVTDHKNLEYFSTMKMLNH